MSLLSEYTETDIQSFNISNPTPPVKPPIDNIQTISYNGSYWLAGGFDTLQTRTIYSFTPSDDILDLATRVQAYVSNLRAINQILTSVDPILYSIPIRKIKSSINNNTAYYKSLLNSAVSKFNSLKSLGYTTGSKEYCTNHTLMISYNGINWQVVEQNPFQFIQTVNTSYKSNFTNSQYRACVKDIKWNSKLSLWVAVGFNGSRRLWNGTGWSKTFGIQIVEGSNVSDYNPTVGDSTTLTLNGGPLIGNNGNANPAVIVSPRTLIATSPDGLIWTSRGTPYLVPNPIFYPNIDAITCFKVACSDTLTIVLGNFITEGPIEYIATSTDCISWSLQAKASSNLQIIPKSIAYNGVVWVVVGNVKDNSSYVSIQASTNGTTWTDVSTGTAARYNFLDVAWNGNTWMAIGNCTINSIVYADIFTSSTGYDWLRVNRLTMTAGASSTMSLAWDGNFWNMILYPNSSTHSYKTEDGITLLPLNVGGTTICTNIPLPILGGTLNFPSALIVGYGTPTSSLRSSDNINWVSSVFDVKGNNFLGEARKDLFGIVWCGTFWIAVGNPMNEYNGKSVVTSTDGFTWTYPSTYLNGTSNAIISKARDVIWTGSLAIVVGDSVATSADGITWTKYNSPFPIINAIAWNGKTTKLTVSSFAASSNGTQVVTVTSVSGIAVGETITIQNASDTLNNGTFLITAVGTSTFTWANSLGVSKTESSTVYAHTSLYVVGGEGGIAISIDADRWIKTSQCPLLTVYDIAWNGYIWIAVGVAVEQPIILSIDGIRWYTANTDTIVLKQCNAIAWNRSSWVAVGSGKNNTIATSVDGYNWVARGNDIFTTSGDMIAFNGTNWIAGGKSYYQLATSTDGITWTGYNARIDTCRYYANKTISLPYTGTATSAIKALVDSGVSTITTLTNATPGIVQSLTERYLTPAEAIALATELAALAAAKAAAEATRKANEAAARLATKISATKYIWEYIYWNRTIETTYYHYRSKSSVITTYNVNYSSITDYATVTTELASLQKYLSTNLTQMTTSYSIILNDNNDQTILDKNLVSMYDIHIDYKSRLLGFYESLRSIFYITLYGIYTNLINRYSSNGLSLLLDTIGFTQNTEKTKSSVISNISASTLLLDSTYTTARNFFVTPITSITFTPLTIFQSEIGNTNLSYILTRCSSNAPYYVTNFDNFNYTSLESAYSQIKSMYDTRINVIDKYYNDTKTRLLEWKTLNNFDSTTATTFSAPSSGIQTITVNQIENIQKNRVVTITGAASNFNNVKAALVLSVSGNTFTIENYTGLAASNQTATVNYSDSTVSYTSLDADFNTLKTTGEIVSTLLEVMTVNRSITSNYAWSGWSPDVISFYTNKCKFYYDTYSNIYSYSNDLFRLTLKFKYSLNLLEFDRKDAITYAEQQLSTVRNEVNYFQLTTRQFYSEELLSIRNHYLRLLTTAVYDSSLYEKVLKLSDVIFIASRIYPTYSTKLENVKLAIILAEADGCKPSINGWGGALTTQKTTQKPQLKIYNPSGVSATNQTAIGRYFIVPKISGFGPPSDRGFQELYTPLNDNPLNLSDIIVGTLISITGASDPVNNVTDTRICGIDRIKRTVLIYNLTGVAATNQNAKGFRSFTITEFGTPTSAPTGEQTILINDPSSLIYELSLKNKYITITGASDSVNNSSIVTNVTSFAASSNGTQVVTVTSTSNIQGGQIVTIIGAANAANNITSLVTAVGTNTFTWTNTLGVSETVSGTVTCIIRSSNYVRDVIKEETVSVAVPGKQQGLNGWKFFNNVYYAIQAKVDYENTIGRNRGTVSVPYSISGIPEDDDGYLTISGNSNSNNNGTFKLLRTDGVYIYVSNPNAVATYPNIIISEVLYGSNNATYTTRSPHGFSVNSYIRLPYNNSGIYKVSAVVSTTKFTIPQTVNWQNRLELAATAFSAPSGGVQTITFTAYNGRRPFNTNRYITITGASNSANNVTNALVLGISGNTFTISNGSGVAGLNQTASVNYADYDYQFPDKTTTTISSFSQPRSDNGNQTITVAAIGNIVPSIITITNAGRGMNSVKLKKVVNVSGNTFTIYNPTGFSNLINLTITNFAASSSGTQILTVTNTTGIEVGDSLTIENAHNPANNGTYLVTAVGANTITWANTSGAATPTLPPTATKGSNITLNVNSFAASSNGAQVVTFTGRPVILAGQFIKVTNAIDIVNNGTYLVTAVGTNTFTWRNTSGVVPSSTPPTITGVGGGLSLTITNFAASSSGTQVLTVTSNSGVSVGNSITIQNAPNPLNNGTYLVTAVGTNTVTWGNTSGVASLSGPVTATNGTSTFTVSMFAPSSNGKQLIIVTNISGISLGNSITIQNAPNPANNGTYIVDILIAGANAFTWANPSGVASSSAPITAVGGGTSLTITNFAASSGGIQVLTVTNTSGISVGNSITIQNSPDLSNNGTYLVTAVGTNTITWANPSGAASPTGVPTASNGNATVSVTNFAASSNGLQVVTFTNNLGIEVGDSITIQNAVNPTNNGTYTISAVNTNSFTWANSSGVVNSTNVITGVATCATGSVELMPSGIPITSLAPTSSTTYGTVTKTVPIVGISEPKDGKQRIYTKLQIASRVGDSITITGAGYSTNNVTNAVILDIVGNMISISNSNGVYEYGTNATLTAFSYPIYEITAQGGIDVSRNLQEYVSAYNGEYKTQPLEAYKPFQFNSIRNTYDGNKKEIEWITFTDFTENQTVETLQKQINDFDTEIDGLRADDEFTEAFMNTKRDDDIDEIENTYLTSATTYLNGLNVKLIAKIPSSTSLTITAFSALTTNLLANVLEKTTSSPSVLSSTAPGDITPSPTNIIGPQQYNTVTYQILTVDNTGTIEPYKNTITITGASSSGNNVTNALVIDVVGNTIKIINPTGVAGTSQTATGKYGDLIDFASNTWNGSATLQSMVTTLTTAYNTFLTIKNTPLTAITTTKTITSFGTVNTGFDFSAGSYNTQVITVNSIGNIIARMTIRITGAANSKNNGIFKVLQVSGNTFKIENSKGVAATNSNAGSASYISFDYSLTTAEDTITTINEIQETEAYITMVKGIEVYRKRYTNAVNLVRRVGNNTARWLRMKANALVKPYPIGILSTGDGKPFITSIPPSDTNYWAQRPYKPFALIGETVKKIVNRITGLSIVSFAGSLNGSQVVKVESIIGIFINQTLSIINADNPLNNGTYLVTAIDTAANTFTWANPTGVSETLARYAIEVNGSIVTVPPVTVSTVMTYNADAYYSLYDYVSYNNGVYCCIKDNTNYSLPGIQNIDPLDSISWQEIQYPDVEDGYGNIIEGSPDNFENFNPSDYSPYTPIVNYNVGSIVSGSYSTNIVSFVASSSGTQEFRVRSNLGIQVGDTLTIKNASNSANNGSFTIISINGNTLTVTSFAVSSNGTQVLTVTNTTGVLVGYTVTIQNAANSANNGTYFITAVGTNTVTWGNSSGVSNTPVNSITASLNGGLYSIIINNSLGVNESNTSADYTLDSLLVFRCKRDFVKTKTIKNIPPSDNSYYWVKRTYPNVLYKGETVEANFANFQSLNPPSIKVSVVSFASSATTQVVTVQSTVGIVVGQILTVTGASNTVNNGTYLVSAVNSNANTFTWANPVGVAEIVSTNNVKASLIKLTSTPTYDNNKSYGKGDTVRVTNLQITVTGFAASSPGSQLLTVTSSSGVALGDLITIQDSSDLGNNGTYIVTAISTNTITWANSSGVSSTTSVSAYIYKYYYLRTYNDKIYIQGKPPGTTFPAESLWQQFLASYSLNTTVNYSASGFYTNNTVISYNSKYYYLFIDTLNNVYTQNIPPSTTARDVFYRWNANPEGITSLYPAYNIATKYGNLSSVVFNNVVYVLQITENFFIQNIAPTPGDTTVKSSSHYWSEGPNPATISTYDIGNLTPYKNGDFVNYNDNIYLFKAPIGFNIQGQPPGTTIASELAWIQITHPAVFVKNGTSGSFLECTSSAFPLLNYANYPAYSTTEEYKVGDIVQYNDKIYQFNPKTSNVIGINITNTTYWENIANQFVKYNGEWVQYRPNLITRLYWGNFTPYSDFVTYVEGSKVSYEFRVFKCIDDNPRGFPIKGKVPTSTQFWKKVTYPLAFVDGEVIEADPTNPVFKKLDELDYHNYENNWLYYKGDLVSYNGLVYECINVKPDNVKYPDSISGKSPLTTTGFWEQVSSTDIDFINNNFYKVNNIFPWNPITTKKYGINTIVLWKGFLYKSQKEISYKLIIDLNSSDDIALIKSYIPSANELLWRKIDEDWPTSIPKVYSNTATYYLSSQVMIHDFLDQESVVISITSPFRIRIFKLTGFNKTQPQKYKHPEVRTLNELDSDGYYKNGIVPGTSSKNNLPRYGIGNIDPFRLDNYAGDLKHRVSNNVLLPYLHAKNNAKSIMEMLNITVFTPSNYYATPEYETAAFVDWSYPQAFNFKENPVTPVFAEQSYNKLKEAAQSFVDIFNYYESDTIPLSSVITNFAASSGGKQVLTANTVGYNLVIGDTLTIDNTYNSVNKGSYIITNLTTTTITWANPSGVFEAFPGSLHASIMTGSTLLKTVKINAFAASSSGSQLVTILNTTPLNITATQGSVTVRVTNFATTSQNGTQSVSVAGSTVGITVGQNITIANAINSSNNGTYLVTAVFTNSFTWENPFGIQITVNISGAVNSGNNGTYKLNSLDTTTFTWANPNGTSETKETGTTVVRGYFPRSKPAIKTSIRNVLGFVYYNLTKLILKYRDNVIVQQINKNVLKTRYYNSSFFQKMFADDPYPYFNVAALSMSPPVKCLKDLGVGDEAIIKENMKKGLIPENSLEEYNNQKEKLDQYDGELNALVLDIKTIINYYVIFHYRPDKLIGVEINLPIDYYYADGYTYTRDTQASTVKLDEPSINIAFFILGPDDYDHRNNYPIFVNDYLDEDSLAIIENARSIYDSNGNEILGKNPYGITTLSYGAIINDVLRESLKPPEYTLPNSQAARDLILLTYETKDPAIKGLSNVAKGLVGLCAAAVQVGDMVSGVVGAVQFVGNWAVTGKPDGQVTSDTPGGAEWMQFSGSMPNIKWPEFNERAQSIIALKDQVRAHRLRLNSVNISPTDIRVSVSSFAASDSTKGTQDVSVGTTVSAFKVGQLVTITGATNSVNNGVGIITKVTETTFTWANPVGVAEVALRTAIIASVKNTTEEDDDNLDSFLITVGALIINYTRELDELQEALDYEFDIRVSKVEKTLVYPLSPTEPTRVVYAKPKPPTKTRIAYDDLLEELARLQRMYDNGLQRNYVNKLEKIRNKSIDITNNKIKVTNTGTVLNNLQVAQIDATIRRLDSQLNRLVIPDGMSQAVAVVQPELLMSRVWRFQADYEQALKTRSAQMATASYDKGKANAYKYLPAPKSQQPAPQLAKDVLNEKNIEEIKKKRALLERLLLEAREERAKWKLGEYLESQKKLGTFNDVDLKSIRKNIADVNDRIRQIIDANNAASAEFKQYQDELNDAEMKQAEADEKYRKAEADYNKQKLEVQNATDAINREIEATKLEAKRLDYATFKVNYDNLTVSYEAKKYTLVTKILESNTIYTIMSRNMPANVKAAYSNIIDKFSTTTNPIITAYKGVMTNLKATIGSRIAVLKNRRIASDVTLFSKIIKSKATPLLNLGGPLMEIAGIALTAYSMGAFSEGESLDAGLF